MGELQDQLRNRVDRAVTAAGPCVQQRRRATAPNKSGELAKSITAKRGRSSGSRFRLTVTATAEHGQIINKPQAGRITAKGDGFLAFDIGGNTLFRKSVKQSTKHKGWWDDYEWIDQFENCLRGRL